MQEYIDVESGTVAISTADRSHAEIVADIKTIMESLLSNQGEESNIYLANVECVMMKEMSNPNLGWTAALYLLVADAAIADSVNQDFNNIDQLLDTMTSGDFEFIRLTPFVTSRIVSAMGNGTTNSFVQQAFMRADITKQLKRASKKLIQSAILATNPEISLVLVSHAGGNSITYYHCKIYIKYDVKTKQARML